MANLITVNPITCDTTGVLVTGPGLLKSVQFTNTGVANDFTLILVDGADTADTTRKLVQLEITTGRHTIVFCPCSPIPFHKNLVCSTIDGGEALIQV